MSQPKHPCPGPPAHLTRRRFLQGVASAAAPAFGGPLTGAEQGRGLPPASWWPEWRHDGHRSGRSGLAGAIRRPAEHWRYYLGSLLADDVDDQTEAGSPDVHDLD